MTFRLFDAPEREPSQFVGFAGNIASTASPKTAATTSALRRRWPIRRARLMLMRRRPRCC